MAAMRPAGRFDAFRALSERRGRAGERLVENLARTRAGTVDRPESWAPAVAAGLGLPAAAALGPAAYYADLVAPHGRRHIRVCSATACFAARSGRHLPQVEQELGVTVGTVSPDGETSLQAVRCLGYCYAGPAALDGAVPCTGPALAAQLAGHEPPSDPQMPVADDTGAPCCWPEWSRMSRRGRCGRGAWWPAALSRSTGRWPPPGCADAGSGLPGGREMGGGGPGARHRAGGQRR
ncbi:NAD(P)H-dependent oxidoreductase subunit E [Streptomyces sp. INA 01156]